MTRREERQRTRLAIAALLVVLVVEIAAVWAVRLGVGGWR